eukprot:tig00000802_g4311.t1
MGDARNIIDHADVCPVPKPHEVKGAAIAVPTRTAGSVRGLEFPCERAAFGFIAISGVDGGLEGPSGLYPEVAAELSRRGVHALVLDYRRPARLEECIIDLNGGIDYLRMKGVEKAREIRPAGVITIASQTGSCDDVDVIGKPVLFIHGEKDTCLSAHCSRILHRKAQEPKELLLLPEDGHCIERSGGLVRDRIVDFVTKNAEKMKPGREF